MLIIHRLVKENRIEGDIFLNESFPVVTRLSHWYILNMMQKGKNDET